METARLEALFAAAQRLGATAIHLVPGRTPALRVQRRFVAGDDTTLQPSDVDDLTRDLLFSDHRERLRRNGHVEVLYVARSGGRYRASVAELGGRCSIVMRPVPLTPPKAEALGLPEQVAALARFRSGLVVVSGSFGAGKSTTLAAIVDACNDDEGRHIVTLEDSIQFVHENRAALLHQREVGTHVGSAVEGVRQAMASGVDVIVVAEVRDAATLDAAISAAESGCLVFVGVEAGSITAALAELSATVSVEERPRLRTRLASVLRGATGQRLLHRLHKGGRVPVVEVLVASQAVRQAVRAGRLQELPGIMNRCRGLGMQTTDVALRGLLAHHVVTQEEALLHACNPEEVVSRLSAR
ncbi:MAG: Flp pilus assembly complex ATPase component TadA [Planctomycetes bacterium]|nr:Flp pilus assembly complex ATPase component TadA [Planctomycetota bacterium]